MSATTLLATFLAYTVFLFCIARRTSRNIDHKAFYIGDRQSHWLIIAYGMIGASLSGVTFMSIPGNVYRDNCFYAQFAFSFLIGYAIVAFVLMPLYYKLNLTSIYSFLEQRFGFYSYKSGATFFIVSRLLGAAIRTYVVIMVLHVFLLKQMGIPFWLVALVFVLLAILYTYQGGVQTMIWTDTFQTTLTLLALVVTVLSIAAKLDISFSQLCSQVAASPYATIVNWDTTSPSYLFKHVIAGVFTPIVMTGLDQGMMQKNMSCKNIREAQKNMILLAILAIGVISISLFLGVTLTIFCDQNGITIGSEAADMIKDTDHIFPTVAFHHLGMLTGLMFFLGLISAAYPTCANSLTALTTTMCVDMIGLEKNTLRNDKSKKNIRLVMQWIVTFLFLGTILTINALKCDSVVNLLYWAAAYTYGPLMALYAFGLYTKRRVWDHCVPLICVIAVVACFAVEYFNVIGLVIGAFHGGSYRFSFGFALLLVNACLTLLGLFLCSTKPMTAGPHKFSQEG